MDKSFPGLWELRVLAPLSWLALMLRALAVMARDHDQDVADKMDDHFEQLTSRCCRRHELRCISIYLLPCIFGGRARLEVAVLENLEFARAVRK